MSNGLGFGFGLISSSNIAGSAGITLEDSAVTTGLSFSSPLNIDVNIPAVSANDILLLFCTTNDNSDPTTSPPSGWTKIAEQDGPTSSVSTVAAYWKRASSSASATTETWSAFYPGTEAYYVWVGAYSGCVTSGSPVDAYGSSATNFSTPWSVNVTTTTADTMIVTISGNTNGGITHTWSDGTELIDTAYYSGGAAVSINEKIEVTTGSKTRTVTPSVSGSNSMIAVALKSNATDYVLDDLSVGVDFAFSVSRYLSSTYVGSSVVKLREDNGDTTSDFKIVNGALVTNDANEYTVSTWLSNASATNAYVQTWYDQSGNSNDIQQLTNGYQPTYAASWTNGRASVNNPSGQHFLATVSSFTASNTSGVSCYVACEEVNSGVLGGIFGDPNSTTFGLNFNVQKPLYVADFGVEVKTTNDVSRAPHVISYEGDAGTGAVPVTIRVDSVQDASASMAHDQRSGNWLMFNSRSSSFNQGNIFVGYIGELIYAKSEFSTADRDVVEDSMLNWFNIS